MCINFAVGTESKETVATGKTEDVKSTNEEKAEAKCPETAEQPATLTACESASTPAAAPTQPQNDDQKAVSFSIGPNAQQIGTPHTNADKALGDDSHVHPEPIKIPPSSSASFQTNADIPQDMMGPPFSAPPTPAHRPQTHTVEKQYSTPQFSNVPKPHKESHDVHKDELQSQVSYGDLQYPTQKVSMDDDAIMQRQQQRFKLIEEQNKTKPLQPFKHYSDPYSYKSTERTKRAQGWC